MRLCNYLTVSIIGSLSETTQGFVLQRTHTHSRQSGGLKSSLCSYQNSLLMKNLVFAEKCVKLGQILFVFLFVVISLDLHGFK